MINSKVTEILEATKFGPNKMDYWTLEAFISNQKEDLPEELKAIFGTLLRQFSKPIKATAKQAKNDDASWVSLAVCRDDARPHLMNIFAADKNTLVATDGHRMHVVQAHDQKGITAGARYNLVKGRLIEVPCTDTYFLPYDRVMPKNQPIQDKRIPISKFAEEIDGSEQVLTIDMGEGKVCLSRRYVLDAFAGHDTMDISMGGPNDTIAFKRGKRLAVVMPIRMGD